MRGHKSLTTTNLTNSNAMLYEYILYLQGIELGYWKRGIPATLSLLKDAVKKKSAVNISFSTFAKSAIDNSDKKQSTKDNLHSTLAVLNDFRSGLDFKDITYTFLRDFEQYLREKGNADNTIAKHMKQLRILVNEGNQPGIYARGCLSVQKLEMVLRLDPIQFLPFCHLNRFLQNNVIRQYKATSVLGGFIKSTRTKEFHDTGN